MVERSWHFSSFSERSCFCCHWAKLPAAGRPRHILRLKAQSRGTNNDVVDYWANLSESGWKQMMPWGPLWLVKLVDWGAVPRCCLSAGVQMPGFLLTQYNINQHIVNNMNQQNMCQDTGQTRRAEQKMSWAPNAIKALPPEQHISSSLNNHHIFILLIGSHAHIQGLPNLCVPPLLHSLDNLHGLAQFANKISQL